jgi:predicted nucleic acid-binding protein
VIFVDSNVPMYLIGAPHPLKSDAQRLLESLVTQRERLVTDRYVAIERPDAIQPALDALLGLVDEVFPIDRDAVERAKRIVLGQRRLSARDAIHVATMEQHAVARIMSFDTGFDGVPGIQRIC